MPHTTYEAYLELPNKEGNNIYLTKFPKNTKLKYENLVHDFNSFNLLIRTPVLKSLEIARENKVIGKSLEAHIKLVLTNEQVRLINSLFSNIKQVFIASNVDIIVGDDLKIEVKKAQGFVCVRCWNIVPMLDENELCLRCTKIIQEYY